ncbi:jg1697 [Pararge aegeria aegeria]|uniref:Jg1697 protein n=1 Tax=Pararge aegeria aegeria TaxID=348720 RepID=A0A8S4SRF4_9NEOP|nr:jg1697 [Pararge aegeria aegeria]
MNVLEKAEKALEYLKHSEGLAKGHELQAAAGTLGRCLGALGGRHNCARHYANLLHSAIPTLLTLASNESAEVRLLGDEALNRAVAGGYTFHSYKTNILLQNQIDVNKNARWIRAALSRICIGDCWLRPGVGKIRYQAQTLFPKLSQIVRQTNEIQLIVEALDLNLPRLLKALAEYTTDEEISELSKALLGHVECSEPAVRRGIANCVAHLCSHREPLLTNVLARVYEKLWPSAQEDNAVVGWFCVIKAIFQINNISKFKENDLFSAQDYLELYQLCIHYIEQTTIEHNIQNTVMECLSVLLSQAKDEYKRALLEKNPRAVCLDDRRSEKGHRRNISYTSAISSKTVASMPIDVRDTEITFSGALQLGSLLQLNSECGSMDELAIQTPDSPESDLEIHMTDAEQLSRDLSEKLQEYEDDVTDDEDVRTTENTDKNENFEYQHMSDLFLLLESHNDPQIRGLARVCIGNYLVAALDLAHGDYNRWRNYSLLPKEVSANFGIEKLIEILLKGLADEIHSSVNHTLTALITLSAALCNSVHWCIINDALNSLISVMNNSYWLVRVNLARLYESLPYSKLFTLHPEYYARARLIMDALLHLLADQDQKVRTAAAQAISSIVPKIYPPRRATPVSMMTNISKEHIQFFNFDSHHLSLELVREIYFYNDLPEQLKKGLTLECKDSLMTIVGDLVRRMMASDCKHYSQGLLETLRMICCRWSPWKHIEAYSDQGILSYCLDNLDYCNGVVSVRTTLLDICRLVYPVESLERLLQSLYRDVLLEQTRVEILLKILFKAPPDQETTPRKLKLRYLTIVMVLLRKVLVLIPETEVLLSINYLKSTCISPQSIFFNVKPNVDPLNVQNVNENCANLSPDVILVRFLFKTLTYVIMEMDDFQANVDLRDDEDKDQNRLLYAVCVNIIVQAKHMLHLTNGCLFPLTAKMAQTILHNEQSGLNTGLYSPEENIPLDVLNLICLKLAHRNPTLTVHWSHLLIRLNFLSHKYWHKLIGFARNLPLSADSSDTTLLRVDLLQTACVMAYCEYFVDNGLSEAVHLTWLLVNRVHVLVSQFSEEIIRNLIDRVQQAGGASGLMLQAVAARCQSCLKSQIKSRCCQADCEIPKVSKHTDLAQVLSKLSLESLTIIMTCPEFDRKILSSCFKIGCESFTRDFLSNVSIYELRETEIETIREQRENARVQDEMASSVDSNKLSVVNSLHVFKKSDNRESKSQFFIPIMENDVKEKFGNLKIIDEDSDIMVPELPKLYLAAVATLDKSLSDVLRLFPKQNRPLSQSENFSLNVEQTIDRYTKRCHQVFQDKLFYQEFITIQTILTGFLDAVDKVLTVIDETDCDLIEKCVENIIPNTLARNIAVFSVVSLQYLSFMIKNKKVVETPVNADVSFRATNAASDNVCVDHVMIVTIDNVAKALQFNEIWSELNVEINFNRAQSAISCFYAIVKYLVKDTKPLILKTHLKIKDSGPQPDIIITSNKLATLVEYWEENFYTKDKKYIIGKRYRKAIESLLISLARLEIVSNVAIIPTIAWSYVDVRVKMDQLEKIDLPLQPLQDMDVLEAFLFRVNLIGWSSKKQFEEIWVGILGALQGNGTHWAVNGITQLLLSVAPSIRGKMLHVPRKYQPLTDGMQRLRNILIGTSAYSLFEDANLERVPLLNEGHRGFHYGQFSTEFLKYAADISDEASYKVRKEVKRKRKNKEIDINSCLQLLMDVTTDMLDSKCAAATSIGAVLSTHTQWSRVAALLSSSPPPQWALAAASALHSLAACLPVLHHVHQELTTVHEKLLKSLGSSFPPQRQAALRGWLLQLPQYARVTQPEAITQLRQTTVSHLTYNFKLSLHEQSLYWAVLFTLVELGHPDLVHIAVDFVLANPRHYCADLVVKGITSVIRQQVLPKDLKNIIIEKLLDIENMKNYSENHAVQILMVHLFSADNRLISPKLESDVSNMDPDVLMNSMERITLLYKVLRQCKRKENKNIVASALKYFLRETLPPAATLSRVVIEYLECCKETERKKMAILSDRNRWIDCSVLNAEIVFEVFETSVNQDQLPVLSGWIFEALCHLLSGKISTKLLPYCLLTLLVSASSNQFIRSISPLSSHIFRVGLHKSRENSQNWGDFADFVEKYTGNMSFSDRRLLCIVALHSYFSANQLERLKELCEGNEQFNDLMQCLTA